jgi:hypothetical protein
VGAVVIKSKSYSRSSMDYQFERYQVADLIRLDIQINQESVDALALIIHREYPLCRRYACVFCLSFAYQVIYAYARHHHHNTWQFYWKNRIRQQ